MDNFFADYPVQGGSSSGVTSLNGLTGALTLVAGSGITITPSGSTITIAATGSSSVPLSSLTAAVATNTIDNLNFAQTWNWSTLTSQTALTLSSDTLSGGNLIKLTSSGLTAGSLLDVEVNDSGAGGVGINLVSSTSINNIPGMRIHMSGTGATRGLNIQMDSNAPTSSAILVNQQAGTAFEAINTGLNGVIPLIKLANYNTGAANGDGAQINFAANNSGGGHVDIGYITGYLTDITTNAGILSINTPNVAALSNDILVNTGDTTDPAGLSGNIILRPGTGSTASSNSGSILLATQSIAGASGIAGDILLTAGSGNSHSGNIVLRLTNDEGPFGSLKIKDGSEGTPGYVWTSIDTAGSGTWMPASGGGSAAGPSGAVQFSNGSGTFLADDASFHWDDAAKSLSIGITPSTSNAILSIDGDNGSGNGQLYLTNAAQGDGTFLIAGIESDPATILGNPGAFSMFAGGGPLAAIQAAAIGGIFMGGGGVSGSALLSIPSTNKSVQVQAAQNNQSDYPMFAVGDGGFDGGGVAPSFVGFSSGTYIGLNGAASTPMNLMDLQVAGVSAYSISNVGKITTYAAHVDAARIVIGDDTISATLDYKIVCNATAGAFNLNLPPGEQGLNFILVQAAANSGTFTIVPDGSDVLDTNIQAIFNTDQPVPITFLSGTWYAV